MIASKTHPSWKHLVSGDISVKFSIIAGNMLLNRHTRMIKSDDSMENIQNCIDEAYNYFSKYFSLYEKELNEIFK